MDGATHGPSSANCAVCSPPVGPGDEQGDAKSGAAGENEGDPRFGAWKIDSRAQLSNKARKDDSIIGRVYAEVSY